MGSRQRTGRRLARSLSCRAPSKARRARPPPPSRWPPCSCPTTPPSCG